MEEECVRLRLQRLYKLTATEADELIKEAEKNRRQQRLLQVRSQSKQLSQTLAKNVRTAERNALTEMSNTLKKEWEAKRAERLALAEAEYNAAVEAKGEAQRLAKQAAKNKESNTQVDQHLVAKRLQDAEIRYKKGSYLEIFSFWFNFRILLGFFSGKSEFIFKL